MRLSTILKNIYTSGEAYTVLTLLKKLIEAVEEYESEELNKGLFQHKLTFGVGANARTIVVVNTSPVAITSSADITDIYGTLDDYTMTVAHDDVTKII